MTLLASSEGSVVFVIVAIVVAIVGQISEARKKQKAESEPSPPPRPNPPTRTGDAGTSEQERLRRFLESLGVPANQPPPVPPARQQPASYQKVRPQQPQRQKAKITRRDAQPVPQRAAALPRESLSPGRLEEPAAAIEQIAAQHDSLARGLELSPAAQPPAFQPSERAQNSLNEALRSLLKSPPNLRTALLAREILGPPKSLAE